MKLLVVFREGTRAYELHGSNLKATRVKLIGEKKTTIMCPGGPLTWVDTEDIRIVRPLR